MRSSAPWRTCARMRAHSCGPQWRSATTDPRRSKTWSTTYVTVKKRITVEVCSVNSSGLDAKACRFISG